MDEFSSMVRQRAAAVMREMFHREVTPGVDPIVELIGFLLEDGAGGVLIPENSLMTTEDWLSWNGLTLASPAELSRAMTRLLKEERIELPTDLEAMRNWAACLVMSVLDRMEMQ